MKFRLNRGPDMYFPSTLLMDWRDNANFPSYRRRHVKGGWVHTEVIEVDPLRQKNCWSTELLICDLVGVFPCLKRRCKHSMDVIHWEKRNRLNSDPSLKLFDKHMEQWGGLSNTIYFCEANKVIITTLWNHCCEALLRHLHEWLTEFILVLPPLAYPPPPAPSVSHSLNLNYKTQKVPYKTRVLSISSNNSILPIVCFSHKWIIQEYPAPSVL